MPTSAEFVCVVWHDAADSETTWVGASEVDAFASRVVEVASYGFILKRTKQYITLYRDIIEKHDSEPVYGGVTKIPRKMIKAITPLTLGDPVPCPVSSLV